MGLPSSSSGGRFHACLNAVPVPATDRLDKMLMHAACPARLQVTFGKVSDRLHNKLLLSSLDTQESCSLPVVQHHELVIGHILGCVRRTTTAWAFAACNVAQRVTTATSGAIRTPPCPPKMATQSVPCSLRRPLLVLELAHDCLVTWWACQPRFRRRHVAPQVRQRGGELRRVVREELRQVPATTHRAGMSKHRIRH